MSALPKTKVIAITGTIGSGKSTAGHYLKTIYPVLDCDQVNAELLQPGHEGEKRLRTLSWIHYDQDGKIDKQNMASQMFQDHQKKQSVESILHPLIFEAIDRWEKEQKSSLLFVEIPLLFEIGAQDRFDEVWCVAIPNDLACKRLVEGRGFLEKEARQRIKNQFSLEYKVSNSDKVFWNTGSQEQLIEQIKKACQEEGTL